jgi:hypothetical protein
VLRRDVASSEIGDVCFVAYDRCTHSTLIPSLRASDEPPISLRAVSSF